MGLSEGSGWRRRALRKEMEEDVLPVLSEEGAEAEAEEEHGMLASRICSILECNIT
jgi:hypothetical protein